MHFDTRFTVHAAIYRDGIEAASFAMQFAVWSLELCLLGRRQALSALPLVMCHGFCFPSTQYLEAVSLAKVGVKT
jgi:hypothetical protein